MRIVLIISSLSCGGAERVMSCMANYWSKRGEAVTLITIYPENLDFYSLHPGVKRIALGLERPLYGGFWTGVKNILVRAWRLRAAIRMIHPDVVISFMDRTNVLTLISCRGLAIPVVVSEHIDPNHYKTGLILSLFRRMIYPSANIVVVLTERIRQWAEGIVRKDVIRVIPNPIWIPIMSNRESPPVSNKIFKVLAIGRLTSQKGFDLLIRAFSTIAFKNPYWHLIILGEGEERAKLEVLNRDLGISDRVELPGRTEDPIRFLKDSDLFVLSSLYEGFPMVLLEAMACGLPVISFDCPSGPKEIIRNGVDGILIPPQDIEAMANAMNKLMNDPDERKRLGSHALDVHKRFSVEKVMGIWDELLREVVKH